MLHPRIQLIRGDITTLYVDAVVTAANESLIGGGGVDGAIHRAAGSALFDECQTIGICPAGEARMTAGYLLPAKHVIHTVGPVWDGGDYEEAEILTSCYHQSLQLAANNQLQTIAFPCIATGVYRFPKEQACQIAVSSAVEWLAANDLPRTIIFCCFEEEDYRLYAERLGAVSEVC